MCRNSRATADEVDDDVDDDGDHHHDHDGMF